MYPFKIFPTYLTVPLFKHQDIEYANTIAESNL